MRIHSRISFVTLYRSLLIGLHIFFGCCYITAQPAWFFSFSPNNFFCQFLFIFSYTVIMVRNRLFSFRFFFRIPWCRIVARRKSKDKRYKWQKTIRSHILTIHMRLCCNLIGNEKKTIHSNNEINSPQLVLSSELVRQSLVELQLSR